MTAPTLEAERAAPKLLDCPFCGGKSGIKSEDWPDGSFYRVFCESCRFSQMFRLKEQGIAAWNRRTAARVAEGVALLPLDAEGLPPLPIEKIAQFIDENTDRDFGLIVEPFARAIEREAVAPYAERIRILEHKLWCAEVNLDGAKEHVAELERELATFKGEHATQLATKSIEDDEDFWALVADWIVARGTTRDHIAKRALIDYIDGRTAGTAWISVGDRLPAKGQQVIAFRPTAAQTQDSPISLIRYAASERESWQGVKHGFDCICHPTHWMPLPAAPSPLPPKEEAK